MVLLLLLLIGELGEREIEEEAVLSEVIFTSLAAFFFASASLFFFKISAKPPPFRDHKIQNMKNQKGDQELIR